MSATTLQFTRSLTLGDAQQFAGLSGDDNPIHLNAASCGAFGAPVAHGLMLVGVLTARAATLRPGAAMRDLQVMFPAPCYFDVETRFFLVSTDDEIRGLADQGAFGPAVCLLRGVWKEAA